MPTIQEGRHYELPSTELARWLEHQAPDSWWNVDGDPLLTGRLPFPCPADELVPELRKINRPLLVQARAGDFEAKGQTIDATELSRLVARFAGNLQSSAPLPEWANDRFFYLCWKGARHEWLLAEDSVSAREFREGVSPKAT
jgi:hypothetical protein